MNEKILFVDDEERLLQSIERQLRKTFHLRTAVDAMTGLELLNSEGPFAVVVSDLRMPEVDGISFLQQVKQHSPDTVRIMLSGDADLQAAIEAVNSGQIFRFLTKPCSTNALTTVLSLGIRHHQLIVAERELLGKTLKGCINMMSELLSLADNNAFSCGFRIRTIVSKMVKELELKGSWQYEIAALLSQVGCVAIPPDILEKARAGMELTDQEQEIFNNHPHIGANLVGQIPRLEKISHMIGRQLKEVSWPDGEIDTQDEIGLGASILRVVLEYDHLICIGLNHDGAITKLASLPEIYSPRIVEILNNLTLTQQQPKIQLQVKFDDLIPGMIAAKDIHSHDGTVIIAKNQEITWSTLQGLQNFIDHIGIKEPISVWSDMG